MEHRWNVRLPIQTEVALHHPTLGRVRGLTRDISFEGMYVETGPVQVDSKVLVSIEFDMGGGHGGMLRIPAFVIRTDHEGIGLMFTDGYDEKIFNGLARVLGGYLDRHHRQHAVR